MSLANPFATKTTGVSTIPATEVNAAGVAISSAIDGVSGGEYTPTDKIVIDGSFGLEVSAPIVLDALSDQQAQLDSTRPPQASSRRLLHRSAVDGTSFARIYVSRQSPIGLEYVVGAAWDGAQWVRDGAATATRMLVTGGGEVRVEISLAGATFAAWDTPSLSLRSGNPASGAFANTLYSSSIPKAWGLITTDGAGGVTIVDAFGVEPGSDTIASGDIEITLTNSMASANYAVIANNADFTGFYASGRPDPVTPTTVINLRTTNSGTQVSAASNVLTTSFVVFGEQA